WSAGAECERRLVAERLYGVKLRLQLGPGQKDALKQLAEQNGRAYSPLIGRTAPTPTESHRGANSKVRLFLNLRRTLGAIAEHFCRTPGRDRVIGNRFCHN